MKKLVVLAISLMSIGAVSLSAQPHGERRGPEPEKRAERMAAMMAEKLELNDTQKQQVYELDLAMAKEHRESMENQARTREDSRHDFERQMETRNEKMKEILTAEQYQKWTEMKPEGPVNERCHQRDGEKKKKKRKNKSSSDCCTNNN